MPTFEQLANLGPNFSVQNALDNSAPSTLLTTSTARYQGQNSGYQLFGLLSLSANNQSLVGGNIVQIDLLDASGALAGRISGINGLPVTTFKSLLFPFSSDAIELIFSGDDIIISPQRSGPTLLEGFAGNDLLRASKFFGSGNDTLDGGSGNDELHGFNGNDLLLGGLDDDELFGGNGLDTLMGGTGVDVLWGQGNSDLIDGGAGTDSMNGGLGNDTFKVDNVHDATYEAANEGIDRVDSSVSWTLSHDIEILDLLNGAINGTGNALANDIFGNIASNTLSGLDGADEMFGFGGFDTLRGGNGSDTLDGGSGTDYLIGGPGRDVMTGGVNISANLETRDVFRFESISDLGRTAATRDRITDFRGNIIASPLDMADNIDLRLIDANTSVAGNQAFIWRGSLAFSGSKGELRHFFINNSGTGNDVTVFEGDVNGDKIADMQFEIVGQAYARQDFLL